MQKFIKIAAIGLVITVAAAIGLSGCAKTDAKSTIRATDLTIRRTAHVMNSLEQLQDKQFNFPDAFDHEFSRTRQIRDKKQHNWQVRSAFPDTYDEYLNKLDELYLTCSEIADKNAEIAAKSAQIKDLVGMTRDLGKQLNENKDNLDNPSELYAEIEAQAVSTRQNLERLFSDRRSITKQIKKLPNTNSMTIDLTTVQYERIMGRIDYRLELLDNLITSLEKLNQKLEHALGITEDTQTPEVSAEPVESWRQIFFGFPVIRYA